MGRTGAIPRPRPGRVKKPTRDVTRKSLFYNELAVFRVSKTSTLKTAYYLIANDLRTTPNAKPQLLQPGGELVLRYQVVDGDAEPAGED